MRRHSAKLGLEVRRMNRWKGSTSWALVWSFFILLGGMILYTGYLGSKYSTSQERTPMIINETERAVTESTEHDLEAGKSAWIMQTETRETTADALASVSTSSQKDQEIQRDQNLTDFPCPVQGSPLRSVGNYYSEAFDSYLFHAGMDYAEPEGTVIRATHGGTVIFSGADLVLGQKVILDCGDGWLVTYGGLDNLRVQLGETVETQDAIGQVGLFTATESESDQPQPQLHYEVWYGDEVQSLSSGNS